MKTLAGYLGLICIGAFLYWFNIFSWISGTGFLIFIFVVIAILFVIAFKVLGNPFKQGERHEDK